MKCPRCERENLTEAKFCLECGARLGQSCSQCGTELPTDAKFCLKCGQPISALAAAQSRFPSPEAYTPKHLSEKILASKGSLEGERKQVTVLFADLKGSMELLADRDPEEARKLLDPVLEHMMEAVHRYEGTVNQVMGDGIMALFGAPLAHEDHAVRACYAALRMQERVSRYGDEVRRSHGVPVQIRVGLNSGEVVVRSIGNDLHMDYTAVGQTTHLAARMEQMANPGSIVVSQHTHKLTEGYFQFKGLGAAQVKGVSEQIDIYELLGVGPLRTRLEVSARRGLVRFVGRQPEMEQMRRALDLAKGGHGQIAAVLGEPGVGKSRLCYEFKIIEQGGCLVLEAFSVSHGKAYPYLPITELLKDYFRIALKDDEQTRREKVAGKVVVLDRALEDTLQYLFFLLGISEPGSSLQQMDPQIRRGRTFEAIKRLLLRESLNQPLLVLFEDLHWVDSETQAFLDFLSESVASARVLLLVNYRPEYRHSWGSKTYYTQLRLDPLGPEDAQELLTALLGDGARLASVRKLILEKTEGNPFFMEEVVQTLAEEKVLLGERGDYRMEKPTSELQIPATVQVALAARIDRLGVKEKELLQTLAVIGRQFSLNLLKGVVDEPEEELYQWLSHLQGGEFIYEQPAFPEVEYTFKHALTQEVAYNSVLVERRRVLHERTAQAIGRLYGDRLEEHYIDLAHHYSRSGNVEKAVEYLMLAGQQAVQRLAHEEAIIHFTTGLELLKTLPDTAERTQQELGLQVGLRRVYVRLAQLQAAVEAGEQRLTLGKRVQDPALLLQAHSEIGDNLYHLGEFASARAHLEQGLALYDPRQHPSQAFLYEGPDQVVSILCHLCVVLWHLGYPDQALERGQEALSLARKLSYPRNLIFALNHVAWLHQLRRERQLAQERVEAAITLSTEQREAHWLAFGTILQGWALAERGQEEAGFDNAHHRGIAEMCQGLAARQATGAELIRPYFLALLAERYGGIGQAEEGLNTLGEALAAVHKAGERHWEAELYRLRGELLLKSRVQRLSEAETYFRQAIDTAKNQSAKSLELRAVMSLSRLLQKQGKTEEARQMLAEIYGWFTEGFDTADLKEAKALLEELS